MQFYDKNENEQAFMAWEYITRTGGNLFLTGNAGSGKTTFLRRLREHSNKRMVVVAPTGVAAINAGGVTIHSFFQIAPGMYLPGQKMGQDQFRIRSEKISLIRSLDLLVIDEISMVRADLLDRIDDRLRHFRHSNAPFGGVQLLMIGDLRQLSPVVRDDEWQLMKSYYQTPYFFSSNALQKTVFYTVELKKIYRQTNATFVTLLNKVRENQMTAADFQLLNSRYIPNFKPPKGQFFIRLTTHNVEADNVNNANLALIRSKEVVFKATVKGKFPEQSFPNDERLTLKVGARVMFIKNDKNHTYYNGKTGLVTAISEDTVTVEADDDHRSLTVAPEEWQNVRYELNKADGTVNEIIDGTFSQIPLRLAWAITIHKSQGLTFDNAIIDANKAFSPGQVYVALSRCRSLEGMVLSAPILPASLMTDATIGTFLSNQESQAVDGTRIDALAVDYDYDMVLSLIDFRPINVEAARLERIIDENYAQTYDDLLVEINALLTAARVEVLDVAQKFMLLLSTGRASSTPISTELSERIASACKYFSSHLKSTYAEIGRKLDFPLGNKAVEQQKNDHLAQLADLLALRLTEMKAVAALGHFDVQTVLNARVKYFVGKNTPGGEEEAPKTQTKKTKSSKKAEPKVDTKALSVELFNELGNVDDVATERGLKRNTILEHLVSTIPDNGLTIEQIMTKTRYKSLYNLLLKHRPSDQGFWDIMKTNGFASPEVRFVLSQLNEEQ